MLLSLNPQSGLILSHICWTIYMYRPISCLINVGGNDVERHHLFVHFIEDFCGLPPGGLPIRKPLIKVNVS